MSTVCVVMWKRRTSVANSVWNLPQGYQSDRNLPQGFHFNLGWDNIGGRRDNWNVYLIQVNWVKEELGCERGNKKCDGQFLKKKKKKNGSFLHSTNLITIKKFQEQLIILKSDYDGHFFAQRYFGCCSALWRTPYFRNWLRFIYSMYTFPWDWMKWEWMKWEWTKWV